MDKTMEQLIDDVKLLSKSQTSLIEKNDELRKAVEKANAELANKSSIDKETRDLIEKISKQAAETVDKCLSLERKINEGIESAGKPKIEETLGELAVKSEGFKLVMEGKAKFGRYEAKTAIINATGQNQPLVPADRVPGIIANPNRILTIRDLLPTGRTSSNMIEYTKENVFTNNAGPQYVSPAFENVTKPESGITFTLANMPVRTLAHFIPVSRQVLDDAPMLQSYINGRLMYGLKLEEEDQLLNGNGASGNLSGLLLAGNFTAFNRAVTGDSPIDKLRRAITQAQLSEYVVDTIVLNPADWEDIELKKDTTGEYILANPFGMIGPQLWSKRIVPTNSIAEGTFLVGAFQMGAQLWDRQDAAIQISYEDGDNFKKNMATILAEERLALTVYRPAAFIKGSF